jgi:hypothetical protein
VTESFEVGGEYENSAGRYRILDVSDGIVTVLYLSGDVAGLVGRLDIKRLSTDWEAILAKRGHPYFRYYRNILPFSGLYHLTHIGNVMSILEEGLKCKHRLDQGSYVDIAEQTVQDLRDKITIILRCPNGERRRGGIHDFVPLFFNPIGPMMYTRREQSRQIVIIEVKQRVLENKYTLFSDGNASMQQLRLGPGWHVDVYVSCDGSPCRRQHREGDLVREGSRRPASNIYHGLEHLSRLPWDALTAPSWTTNADGTPNPEGRRVRAAEVLVPQAVPTAEFQRIIVCDSAIRSEVADIVQRSGVALPVEVDHEFPWPVVVSVGRWV